MIRGSKWMVLGSKSKVARGWKFMLIFSKTGSNSVSGTIIVSACQAPNANGADRATKLLASNLEPRPHHEVNSA